MNMILTDLRQQDLLAPTTALIRHMVEKLGFYKSMIIISQCRLQAQQGTTS